MSRAVKKSNNINVVETLKVRNIMNTVRVLFFEMKMKSILPWPGDLVDREWSVLTLYNPALLLSPEVPPDPDNELLPYICDSMGEGTAPPKLANNWACWAIASQSEPPNNKKAK